MGDPATRDARDGGPHASRARATDAWITGIAAVVVTWVIVDLAPTARTGDPTAEVVTQVMLVLALGAGCFVVASRFSRDATGALLALWTGLFLCGGAAVLTNATPFAPLGAVADQSYRTAYLTKFGNGWGLVDYAYKDLPSFYPPLFFWVLGRFSALGGIAAWKMLKVGMLAVAFLVPTGGWLLWRRLVGPRRAAAVVVVTSLVFQDWYVPHLWLAIAVFVPWWCWFVLGCGRQRPLRRGGLAVGVLLGAVVALTYWYVLAIGLVQLLVLIALRRAFRRVGHPAEPRWPRDVVGVLGGTAVVTAVYWAPLVVSVLTTTGARPMQNRYYTPDEVALPLSFLSFDLRGIVLLGGLVALACTAAHRRLSAHLLGLVVGAYLLYAAGYVGFLADTPLDTLRTRGVIDFTLAAGAALGALDVTRALSTGRLDRRIDPRAARPALAVVAIAGVIAFGQTAVRDIPYLAEQRSARYPRQLVEGFARATHGRYRDAVVLTDVTDLSSFLPTYVFNTSNAHYSHPAARFDDRARLLTRLAHERDPDVFALAFLHNRYDDIDYVALRQRATDLTYDFLADAFPRGVAQRSLTFARSSFETSVFTPLRGSPLAVFRVNRARDPLRALRSCPAHPARSRCAVLDPLLRRYSAHLDDEARDLAARWRRAR